MNMIANMASSKQPANSHDLIRVQGARQNNLKDVSVEIPKLLHPLKPGRLEILRKGSLSR